MKWVKASERLPEKRGRYFVKAELHPYEDRITKSAIDWTGFMWHIAKVSRVIEWLDESAESSPDPSIAELVEGLENKTKDVEVLQEIVYDLKLEAGEWIEVKEGNPIPDFDQYVLWAFEDGTCLWDALDKDGSPWLVGGELDGFPHKKATHWRAIKTPIECDELFNIK